MYQRNDGKMTGNHQQGRHFDKMSSGAGGVQGRGSGGGKSKEGSPKGPAELGGDEQHQTQPHPVTGVHEVHIKYHGMGAAGHESGGHHFSVQAIGEHGEPMGEATHHHSASDAHAMAQSHFPNDGDETGEEPGADTLSGITGGMPGQNEEGPHRRGY